MKFESKKWRDAIELKGSFGAPDLVLFLAPEGQLVIRYTNTTQVNPQRIDLLLSKDETEALRGLLK